MGSPKILPEGHKVIIKPDVVSTEAGGGIILLKETADREMAASNVGTIHEVGPTADCLVNIPGEDYDGKKGRNIRKGDRVIFVKNSYSATKPSRHSDDEFWFINDQDIMGIVVDGG